jgi:hypothetical protein
MLKYKYYNGNISELYKNEVFVFGSNLRGIHGAGAAKQAYREFGAIYGCGLGLTGKSYAIPTKDGSIRTLPLFQIEGYIQDFKEYAKHMDSLSFLVTKVGCGLAGYTDDLIAPLFKGSPRNCVFPLDWIKYLEEKDYE